MCSWVALGDEAHELLPSQAETNDHGGTIHVKPYFLWPLPFYFSQSLPLVCKVIRLIAIPDKRLMIQTTQSISSVLTEETEVNIISNIINVSGLTTTLQCMRLSSAGNIRDGTPLGNPLGMFSTSEHLLLAP